MNPIVQRRRPIRTIWVVLTLSLWLSNSTTGIGASRNWNDPVGGFFDDATNWNLMAIPGSGDSAIFDLSTSYTVAFRTNPTNDRLFVEDDATTFNLVSHSYQLASTSSTSLVLGNANFRLGLTTNAALRLLGGTLSCVAASIGSDGGNPHATGSATLGVLTSATLQLSSLMTIGDGLPGAVTVNSGGDVHGVITEIGMSSVGSITMSGTGSSWNNSSDIDVGAGAAGTLNISGGATVTDSHASIGAAPGVSGHASVSGAGSTWTNFSNLQIGNAGSGSLNITSGGTVYQVGSAIGSIGDLPGSTGNVMMDGGTWTVFGVIRVGYQGSGVLAMLNGSTLGGGISQFDIASAGGSSGAVTMSGGSGTLAPSLRCFFLNVGGSAAGQGGSGVLAMTAGHILAADGAGTNNGVVKIYPSGTINLAGGSITSASVIVAGGGHVNWSAGSLQISTLSVQGGGASVTLSAGGDKVLRIAALSIDTSGGSKIDLNDNDLLCDYPAAAANPFSSIRNWITQGCAGGAWNGPGIASSSAAASGGSAALGIADNAVLGLSSFDAQTVDATSTLVKYTYAGDANLDGQVDVTDLGALATHWQTSAPWTGGDFNYDGLVDVTDLGTLATNWQQGVSSPLASSRLGEALATVGLSTAAVPEPALLSAWLAVLFAPAWRRRRRSSSSSQFSGGVKMRRKTGRCTQERRAAAAAIALAAATFCSPTTKAAVYTWNNAAGGVFSTTANWTPAGGPPVVADTAVFQLPNTYAVNFATSPTNTQLQVNDGTVTFNLDGLTYTLSSFASVGVSFGLSPRLILSNGTLSAGGFQVGSSIATNATMTVGPNAHFNSAALGAVALNGAGTLLIQGGGIVNETTFLDIADGPSSVGTLTISDPGSAASCGSIIVGQFGHGVLNITNGGVLNCTSTFSAPMANQVGGSAQATVSGAGSTWNMAGELVVGTVGPATLAITNGGHVSSTFGSTVHWLGGATQASGTLSVTGIGSVWDTSSVFVGYQGRGQADVTAGGVVNSSAVTLADFGTTSFGSINISGAGSAWNCSSNMFIGGAGAGSVTVFDGGALNVGGVLTVNMPTGAPAAVLNLNGGTVSCASFTRLGTFNFNDGTLIIRGGVYQNGAAPAPLVIDGNTVDANPTLVVTGVGGVQNTTNVTVGNNRRGTLMLNDTCDLNIPGTLTIGGTTNGAGSVIVGNGAGFASLEAAGTLGVGAGNGGANLGSATLQINQGGSVYANGGLFLGTQGIVILNGGSLTMGNSSGSIISTYLGGQFQFKSGYLIFNNTSSLAPYFADLYFGPDHVLSTGQSFVPGATATLTNTTTLTLNGGRIAGNVLLPTGSFANSSIITINSGAIDLTGSLTNNAGGLITLAGNGTIRSQAGIVNNGTLVLASPQAQVFGAISNNSVIRGSGNLAATINNNAAGQLLIGPGERIECSVGAFNNSGLVSVIHGEADFDTLLTNSPTGSIAGHDNTLRFNTGLTNGGSLLFTSGQSDVFGNIINNSGAKLIISGAGSATFYNTITNNGGAELRVSSNSNGIFFGPVNGAGSITGSGTKYFEGGTSSMGPLASITGSSVIEPAAAIVADNIRENALTLSGQFTVRPNGTDAATSRLNSLLIDSGTFDLNDNDLVIDYSSGSNPLASIRGDVADGSIRSSLADAIHRLGYADNAVLGRSSFSGQTVDSTTVLVKYTYAGDANLDGQVDVTDLGALATNWQTSAPWTGGDFNYDGFVDVTDLGALATNWQQGVGSPLTPSRLDQALQSVGLSAISVPEPGSTMLLGLSLMLVRARRRAVFC